jgi:hypothetical protein
MAHTLHYVLLPLALACQAVGQNTAPSITGQIRDSKGQPIADAMVQIIGSPRAVRTDSAGFFELPGLPTEVVELRVSRIGFQPVALRISLEQGEHIVWNAVLIPRAPIT